MKKWYGLVCAALALAALLTGCASGGAKLDYGTVEIDPEQIPLYDKPELSTVFEPTADGVNVYSNAKVVIDASNTAQGYVMIKYTGSNPKIKVQIKKTGSTTYTYTLNARSAYEVFPLTDGDGAYSVKVYENKSGTTYTTAMSKSIDVVLADEFLPFLYPNQYVNFNKDSDVVALAEELCADSETDLDSVKTIFNYVVSNFTYDKQKARTVTSGYLPEVDQVLEDKKASASTTRR
jgi:hypothetical protein